MNWKRAYAIAQKETFHILRDPFTLALSIAMPIFLVVIYGIAIHFNVRDIHLAVSDSDQTQMSREFIETFGSSKYFLIHRVATPADVRAEVESEQARGGLIIPPDFQENLLNGRSTNVQLLVDGADNSTSGPIVGYVNAIQQIADKRLVRFDPPQPYDLRTRFLFNPELNSTWFVVPGLTVVVMAILSILLTSLTVAREWESGSMELLLSTPVQPIEIIVGKLAPYGVLGLVAVGMVLVIARLFFGVPFVGNPIIFGAGCLLFLITYLAQGLLISVITRNQQVSMQFAMLTGFLPSQLLSGFIFPIASMPIFFHYFTMIFPARWFINISRDTFLKGSGFIPLLGSFVGLTLICVWMVRRARFKFRRDLEA